MAIDDRKLNDFMGRFVRDFGAVMHAATLVVGEQFGLSQALAEGPATAHALARRTQTDPRYLREWLSAQAASGYVRYEPEGNLNPVARVFFSASTFICTPASRAQEVGLCLVAQSGEARMRDVVMQGGFTHLRRATQTPFNLVDEARP